MKTRHCLFLLVLITILAIVTAEPIELYDGANNQTPDEQGWLYVDNSGNATNTSNNGYATLDTNGSDDIQAGYFSHNPVFGFLNHSKMAGVSLNGNTGFTVYFSLCINSESHLTDDRAGFSMIVITNDLVGLELSFWENEVWAQTDNPVFTHAEGVNTDTGSQMNNYALSIFQNSYTLYKNLNPILEGSLKDYASNWSNPLGFGSKPYDIANFLFFGDDTTSAKASTDLSYIALNLSAVPEPSTTFLFCIAVMALISKLMLV